MSNATATPASWQHEQAGETETVEQLIRRAHEAQAASEVKLSPAKISRIIRKYVAAHGIESALVMVDAYFLTYADPTGETAVRHIMAMTA